MAQPQHKRACLVAPIKQEERISDVLEVDKSDKDRKDINKVYFKDGLSTKYKREWDNNKGNKRGSSL